MRKAVFVLFMTILGSALSAQENAIISESLFLPPTYYVGDEVELRVTIRPQVPMNLMKPQDLPVLSWIEVRSVTVDKKDDEYLLTVRFVSFAAGIKTLPPLRLGDLTLDNLRIYTTSLLSGPVPELAPPRDQVLVPNTEIVLGFFIGLLLLIPVLVWQLWAPAKKKWSQIRRWWELIRPYRILVRDLKKLKAKIFGLQADLFYDQLARIVRQYLSHKLEVDLLASTTTELAYEISKDDSRIPISEGLIPILKKADLVRFDHQDSGESQRLEDLEQVLKTAAVLEGKEDGRVVL